MEFDWLTLNHARNGDIEAIKQALTYMLSNFEGAENIPINFNFAEQSTLFLSANLPDLKDSAIFFRLIGEIFSSLPFFQKIILSGDPQGDEYIISVEIDRQRWLRFNSCDNAL
jgi:hypothetical protein